MKVLVTGGAGFIGSYTCELLLKKDYEVVCLDNFNDFYNPEQKEKNIEECLKNENFKLYRADLRNKEILDKIFRENEIDKIIHLGAMAGISASLDKPELYFEINVIGTLNLLETMKKFGVKHLIFGSSSSIYGEREKGPFSEEDNVDKPISPYASSKKACEELCYCYHHLYGIKVTCLRLFTVYGPRQRPDLAIMKFIKLALEDKPIQLYGDGSTMRDYTYVEDIAEGILKALEKEFDYEIINLGNNNPVKLSMLIDIIEKGIGKKIKREFKPLQKGDVSITFANISKAKKLLKWQPKMPIEKGIRKEIEWVKTK
jgi:UDP-glucuronate 4-epimerase